MLKNKRHTHILLFLRLRDVSSKVEKAFLVRRVHQKFSLYNRICLDSKHIQVKGKNNRTEFTYVRVKT